MAGGRLSRTRRDGFPRSSSGGAGGGWERCALSGGEAAEKRSGCRVTVATRKGSGAFGGEQARRRRPNQEARRQESGFQRPLSASRRALPPPRDVVDCLAKASRLRPPFAPVARYLRPHAARRRVCRTGGETADGRPDHEQERVEPIGPEDGDGGGPLVSIRLRITPRFGLIGGGEKTRVDGRDVIDGQRELQTQAPHAMHGRRRAEGSSDQRRGWAALFLSLRPRISARASGKKQQTLAAIGRGRAVALVYCL
ncbi:hypothetical protein B0J12DRAFT_458724 [Macrophomina phaseolina]|uniref:Uncharacterized protein n=1 Tax=Macrophomina phaseolina TaxID=35725 RepID=A0ABQ8GG87_9PEZI|nr:hypothetical protein B0J12DRAFT_458724 [Macrophomina phaseolina]